MAVGCPGFVIGVFIRPLVASLEACRKSGDIFMNRIGSIVASCLQYF